MWTMIAILLPMAWTMLPLVLLYCCFYGLDYRIDGVLFVDGAFCRCLPSIKETGLLA
jgi:hypothetical protein